MDDYYVLKAKAIPEVLIKVVEAKKLLDGGVITSVKEATDRAGISRSTFYKYKDDIFRFDDHSRGKTITMSIQMQDQPGSLAVILQEVAEFNINILTIHQSIPVSGIATVSLSVEIPRDGTDITELVNSLQKLTAIKSVKLMAGE